MRRREEPVEEQNRVNEEMGSREEVGEGATRKMGTQEEIAIKLKTVEERGIQKVRNYQ